MRILGIDPGTRVVGFGVIEDGGRLTLVEAGCVQAPARDPLPRRLARIGVDLRAAIERTRPDVIVIERAFFGRNAASLIALGEGRGVALLCAAEAGREIFEYAPAEVKKAVVGHGGAKKDRVGEMVTALLGLEQCPSPTDVSDALAVAICHSQRRRTLALYGAANEIIALRVGGGRVRRGRGR